MLSDDKGTWYVTTPGSAVVNRSFAELSVKCEKPDYENGFTSVKSSTIGDGLRQHALWWCYRRWRRHCHRRGVRLPNDISIVMVALGTGSAPVPPAASATAAAIASASLEKAEYLVYKVTDRLTRVERRVRVP